VNVTELRWQLVCAGYVPLPLYGKVPPNTKNNSRKSFTDWEQTNNVTRAMLEMWQRVWPDAQNTGVLTRDMPTIDLDILNEDAVRALELHVRDRFGDRGPVLVRTGKPPKKAIPFRVSGADIFDKFVVNLDAPNGSREKIEFLANGAQVVVAGVHPETGRPYNWHGGEPGQVQRVDLPPINNEEAHELVDELVQILVEQFGYTRAKSRKPHKTNGTGAVPTDAAQDWQDLLDNIAAGRELHDSIRDLAAKMVRSGMKAGAVVNALRALMNNSQTPRDARWQERYDDIVRQVRTAEELIERGTEQRTALALPPTTPPPPTGPTPPAGQAAPQPQPQPQPRPLPLIRLVDGQLVQNITAAEDALIAAGGRHTYQRGDLLVRPVKSQLRAANDCYTFLWQLFPLSRPFMVETFMRVAHFEKMDRRAGHYVPKDCPDKLAESYLSRVGHWRLPVLLGMVNAPFLRPDGTLCEQPGYDSASKLLFVSDGQTFDPIPTNPTETDARTALEYLDGSLLAEFPFIEKIDRSVALSLLLTALDRRSMATAPLHGFTSPVAGTGKSLLVDLASILESGDRAPVISLGKNEEELEKRLGAALIAGDQIISLDNCNREVDSIFLCQALTQQRLKIRMLGFSRHVDTPVTTLFCATGNNLIIADDLTRRTLLCRLDAGVERPELRSFDRDVLETARKERGKLVSAALTVLRAWHVASANIAIGVDPFGSFEDWSFRIRLPLLWLGYMDPCESIATVRDNDPTRSLLIAVLEQWKRALGVVSSYSVQTIITRAIPDMDFFNALMAVAGDRQGGLSNRRLGIWLSKNEGKIVGRLKLSKTAVAYGYPLWQVIET
jgi:putative DNA primase/helicase